MEIFENSVISAIYAITGFAVVHAFATSSRCKADNIWLNYQNPNLAGLDSDADMPLYLLGHWPTTTTTTIVLLRFKVLDCLKMYISFYLAHGTCH